MRSVAVPVKCPNLSKSDISDLQLGESLRIEDIKIGEEVELLGNLKTPIVSCTQPRLSVEEEEEAEETEEVEDQKGAVVEKSEE